MHLAFTTAIRLSAAAGLGALIGTERELRRKPAGLRTNALICLGSALFTIVSEEFGRATGSDHARIAAQIVTGIGFLGAGAIIHSRFAVTGLTTAATIFVVAGVGMAVGAGYYLAALAATVLILLTLFFLRAIEGRIGTRSQMFHYSVRCTNVDVVMETVACLNGMKTGVNLEGLTLEHEGAKVQMEFALALSAAQSEDLIRRLSALSEVESVQAST